ncbi:MAG: 1-phosphofructokinase family hexose kinase [Candidatus Omnitrophica bacterium]|nr:1-phosphofructokinase family hexose kinase [Candidatus Omnitrophota bacterium]MCG2714175.1 1-phosphofructokinase family hexose kinase [Candidatus Omnitrophota bacterium]
MKVIATLSMNPSIDKSAGVDRVIVERKLYCKTPAYEPGDGGVNVSRAIKKLGGESKLFYPSGGIVGQLLNDLLEKEKIGHQPIPIKGTIRENVIIFEESTGLQYRFGMPGPVLGEEEWQKCLDTLRNVKPKPDYIVASGSLPSGVSADFYARVAQIGKERGSRVIIDAPSENLKPVLQEGVYLIKPNIREFRELFGEEIKEESQIKEKARAIVESGQSEVVVISLGAVGVITAFDKTVEHIVPPTVPVISKVGAGDSMVAGIVLSLARGMPVYEAVRFGVAAGTAAVMTPGTELCRREDAERLYQEIASISA